MAAFNFVDAVIGGFLLYELEYFKSHGLRVLDKPKYSLDLDFDAAFLEDEQIFRDNFETLLVDDGKRKLKNWVGMVWNRDAIEPNVTRRYQRWTQVRIGDSLASLRIVDDALFICMFANTFDLLALVEQRNVVDRGHDVPVEMSIDNQYITKLVINANYPWQHEFNKLDKDKFGGIVSLKYAVKLSFPVVSMDMREYKGKKLILKLGIGSDIVKTWTKTIYE